MNQEQSLYGKHHNYLKINPIMLYLERIEWRWITNRWLAFLKRI